jgi:hypothetical protein
MNNIIKVEYVIIIIIHRKLYSRGPQLGSQGLSPVSLAFLRQTVCLK